MKTIDKNLAFILVALFLFVFLMIIDTFSAQWTATWDANAEPDLFGYRLEYLTFEKDWAVAYDGIDTTCIFLTPFDSVCARVFAYDWNGNVSDPSEVVCKKIILGDVNRDGELNVLDLMEFNYRIQQPGFQYYRPMDINRDSTINVADKLQLIFIIKNKGE